jgi:YjbE family integral membrane protein
MEFLNELLTAQFWAGLWQIILINIVLSGDNAVVIALAARSLPPRQQTQAVIWGAGAAVVMRIILTVIAVEMLKWPWLKLIGAALLLWIAVKLLMPEEGSGESDVNASENLWAAIKTILIADLVMSLDNVIAVAAAARGSLSLLILGLAISIPLVVFGATVLMKIMERWPIIITIGAALLGFVAGEMAATDPALDGWLRAHFTYVQDIAMIGPVSLKVLCGSVGAILVVVAGKWLAARAAAERKEVVDLAEPRRRAEPGPATALGGDAMLNFLVPVDGSDSSNHAVDQLVSRLGWYRGPVGIHLLNVQPPVPDGGRVGSVIGQDQLDRYHQEEGMAVLKAPMQRLDAARVKYHYHIGVGDGAEEICRYAKDKGCDQIYMGTRGLGKVSGLVLGSVATKVIQLSPVPVLLVK